MLAAIGRYYHWPRAEIEALSAGDAGFWMGAAGALEEKIRKESQGGDN